MKRAMNAWKNARNRSGHTAIWRFTTANARIKLTKQYPQPVDKGSMKSQVRLSPPTIGNVVASYPFDLSGRSLIQAAAFSLISRME
jgi:hypothetical protein